MWNSYFKFCVERNPWDKTLSHYHMAKSRGEVSSLDAYFQRGKFCRNYRLYTVGKRRPRLLVDRVLDYGSLTEGLGEVFDFLGVPFSGTLEATAKSHYRSDRRPYQEVFNDHQRLIVTQHFKKEIDLHGYRFEYSDKMDRIDCTGREPPRPLSSPGRSWPRRAEAG